MFSEEWLSILKQKRIKVHFVIFKYLKIVSSSFFFLVLLKPTPGQCQSFDRLLLPQWKCTNEEVAVITPATTMPGVTF